MARDSRNASRAFQSKGGRYRSRKRKPAGLLERRVLRKSRGLRFHVLRNASLKRRTLPNPDARAIAVTGKSVSFRSRFADNKRCVCATAIGGAPRCSTNKRRRWRSPTPNRSAKLRTPASSSAPSEISRSARETVVDEPFQAGVPGAHSGRHRRQGRNPAVDAAAAEG